MKLRKRKKEKEKKKKMQRKKEEDDEFTTQNLLDVAGNITVIYSYISAFPFLGYP